MLLDILVILAKKGYYKHEGLGLACYLLKQTLAQNFTDWGVPQKNVRFAPVVPFFNHLFGLKKGITGKLWKVR